MYLEISGTPDRSRCESRSETEVEALGEALKEKIGLKYFHLGFQWEFNSRVDCAPKEKIKRFHLISHEINVIIVYYSLGNITTFTHNSSLSYLTHAIHRHNILWLKCRLYWRKLLYKLGVI